MDGFCSQLIAEERIRKALKEGQFENLEGAGRPLPPDEALNLPPELRMAYRVLKNSGFCPAEIVEEREISRAIDLLEQLTDERERLAQIQKLNVMISRMNMRRNRPVNLELHDEYYRRVVEKVRVSPANGLQGSTDSRTP